MMLPKSKTTLVTCHSCGVSRRARAHVKVKRLSPGPLPTSCRPWLARSVKLLLTSNGLRNATLQDALRDMIGKPFGSANLVYVLTASMAEPGDHGWLVQDMSRLHGLGWRQFDVLELNGLPQPMVLHRLLQADVIYVEGGSHYHLARSITGNDLADGFIKALEARVYVGVSAGSMIFSKNLTEHSADIIGDAADLHVLGATTVQSPFGLFDWYLKPHLDSSDFPERDDAWADRIVERADFPIYFIDDETALRIVDDTMDVVSEGRWRFHP
jgi:dipeptidase E